MLFITIAVLAPLGAFTIAIFIIRQIYKCSYDEALWFFKEVIKDLISQRYSTLLNSPEFCMTLKSDLSALFTEEQNNMWDKKLNLFSLRTEFSGKENNIPFYIFLLPWNELQRDTYESIIRSLSSSCLAKMQCSITDVMIDFMDWTQADYKICRIRYARTAVEQIAFLKAIKEQHDTVMNDTSEVRDHELDEELNLFSEGCKK